VRPARGSILRRRGGGGDRQRDRGGSGVAGPNRRDLHGDGGRGDYRRAGPAGRLWRDPSARDGGGVRDGDGPQDAGGVPGAVPSGRHHLAEARGARRGGAVVTVRVPTVLRPAVGGASSLEVREGTVGEILTALA